MKIKSLVVLTVLLAPLSVQADALFGNSLAGDQKLPRMMGVGIDYFGMRQPYEFDGIPTILPPLPIADFSTIGIDNEIEHTDLKFDIWIMPFLNVFAIYGNIDGRTNVDLSGSGLPAPPITVDYEGDVYGAGITLAGGGERWFASVTATFTETDLSGDLESSVGTTTIQPRLGIRFGDHTELWIGGYSIDAEESHTGMVELNLGPLLGGVQMLDVAVDLKQQEDFNWSVGGHMMMSDAWEATVEVGAGDRRTVLANVTYRFE
jgi:hypothetical protein